MRKLTKEDIEVKVKKVSEKGAVLLLYKTARVDRAILDEEYGVMNWQSDYKTVNDNLYCGIGVYDKEKKEWIWKWDCGIESRADGEGNEKKGEASDAFKRAGFKWGIGVELYSAPFTFAKVETVKQKDGSYKLANQFQKFYVEEINYDKETGDISELIIIDDKGVVVFSNVKSKPAKAPEEPKQQKEAPSKEAVLKKVEECKLSIEKHSKYTNGDKDHQVIANFANKIYALGYKDEANSIIALLEEKTEQDEIPNFK